MSDNENDERETNLSELANDPAHPFDQTNGVVDGLGGDADAPEQADRRRGNGDGAAVLAAPAPGSQMPGGAIPAVAGEEPDADADADADADPDSGDPTPA